MDSREIRERGQFGSRRNIGRSKIKTKHVERLFDISTTKRVKTEARLRPDTVEEFRRELTRVQALRNHRSFVYEKDFRDTVKRVNKKIGDKLTPVQERHLQKLFFAPSGESPVSSKQESSRLARLHASLEDDSPGKPFDVPREAEKEPDTVIGKLRQQREAKQAGQDKDSKKQEPPANLPMAA